MKVFDELKDYCRRDFVFREDIKKITGGLLNHNTMAQLDSRGLGIKNRIMIGRRIAYPIDELISWLEKNATLINF